MNEKNLSSFKPIDIQFAKDVYAVVSENNWNSLEIVRFNLYRKEVYAILWIEHNVTSLIYMHICLV